MTKIYFWLFGILILLGFSDSVFLTWEHYALTSIGCPISPWINCLAVTSSKYSEILGIPLALLGVVYYLLLIFFLYKSKIKMFKHFFLLASSFGVLFSIYLILIQVIAIKLFCLYCLLSAFISFLIFGFTFIFFENEWKSIILDSFGYGYKYIIKPILFLIDAEMVHENIVKFGEILPKWVINIFRLIFVKKYTNLSQKILNIHFKTPIGLAAGFDYEARLTQTLLSLGFGYQTVGTITNMPYKGNPRPMLGRLPKSMSLMVNKGFKSLGAKVIAEKLQKLKFDYPVGISVGRTNSRKLISVGESINDIILCFKQLKNINNSYFELNISCPNLIHANISFYPLKNLKELLTAVDKLKLKKPIFIKMPIDQTKKHFLNMLKTISKHKVKGIIIGNLQTNKKNKSFVKSELNKFKVGKFSGKPTFEDSNRLIKLAYKNYKDRFIIIGCGGVFNFDDAWVKFASGANLVQLVTGMIFEGPQLIAQINRDLSERLTKEGYKNIREIIGSAI